MQCLPEWTQGWWEAIHLSIRHNKKDSNTNPYQLGGVAILSWNRVVHRVSGTGQDPTRLCRFCWTTFWGKSNWTLWIIAGYWPCKTENGHLSVVQQHWRYQNQTHLDKQEHLCSAFWTDLQPLLHEWTEQGDQIILGVDANKDIHTPEITVFFEDFGMTEVILSTHGQEVPPTQNRGSYPIYGIFATRAIHMTSCGYASRLDTIRDHQCLWIDLNKTNLFGNTTLAIISPKAGRLKKTEDPCTVKNT